MFVCLFVCGVCAFDVRGCGYGVLWRGRRLFIYRENGGMGELNCFVAWSWALVILTVKISRRC